MNEILTNKFTRSNEYTNLLYIDRLIIMFLGIFSFLLAWYLLGCFNLYLPIGYDGADTIFMSWLVKRLIDGAWYFNSSYTGFPFGSKFLDFPISDSGNLIILKSIGLLTNNYILTINLYFLLGFSITSLTTYYVLISLKLKKIFCLVAALIFSFLPFHFLRFPHLLYTWYFNVPLYVFFSYKIFSNRPIFFEKNKKIINKIKLCIALLILSCFGIYYAFFATIIFLASGIAGSLKWKSYKNFLSGILGIFIIISGVVINISPNLIYSYKNGVNTEISERLPLESEIYGLKLVEMLLPHPNYRFNLFYRLSNEYKNFPLVNENIISSLGFIGSIGLLILLCFSMTSSFLNVIIDNRLQLFCFLNIFLFLICTIGGFSSLFAILISPMIRAWNRASIFIGFISITSFFLCLDKIINKVVDKKFITFLSIFLGIFFLVLGILDQTPSYNAEYFLQLKNRFNSDKNFVKKIEKKIPKGAVYQLPYMSFPEAAFINNSLMSYDLFRGYLHSSSLHWSFGGIKGRTGDLFFRRLAGQTILRQIESIKKLGFNGIYLDRRGFSDHGASIEKKIEEILGHKVNIVSEDNNLAFFNIPI